MQQSDFKLPSESDTQRASFLLEMYKQTWTNINRHILVVWQSVTVLVGTLAAFSLVEKKILPVDLACAFVVIIAAWQVAHCVDANYWFNRNLAIISNIEAHFLRQDDARTVHPYIGQHRPAWPLLDHLGIQAMLGGAFALLVVGYHFATRVWPGIAQPWSHFEASRTLPYLVLAAAVLVIWCWGSGQIDKYKRFSLQAPGPTILASSPSASVNPVA